MKTQEQTTIHLGRMIETQANIDKTKEPSNWRFMEGYIKALKWVIEKTWKQ